MDIHEFVSSYRNHPVLFIGTGLSLRYLDNSYTWDSLLEHICNEFKGNNEYYLDVKSEYTVSGKFDFSKIASVIETDFNSALKNDRNGKFQNINDEFYKKMKDGVNLSRFKIYISEVLKSLDFKEEMKGEISELKKIRKNIASIITTNYDSLIEHIFDFQPLIGNDILLSNPYGSVYKIHGCVSDPLKIVITDKDYSNFNNKYELVRAQLLSIFIHNPIIFMGYNIGDENIKSLLKTIFTYVEPNSDQAKKIRDNFLLVEYAKDSDSTEITEHDIDLEGFSTIRINKIKTDNFSEIYSALSSLVLPISAMDVRKVQSVVREIYTGGNIKVSITEDLDSLENRDKIIAIGSTKTISYHYQTSAEMMSNYFEILDESNYQILTLINKYTIQSNQYFPVFGFNKICEDIERSDELKLQQLEKIQTVLNNINEPCKIRHCDIDSVYSDNSITRTNKESSIIWNICHENIQLSDLEGFLRIFPDKNQSGNSTTAFHHPD